MDNRTLYDLAMRLGEIHKEKNKLEMSKCEIDSAIKQLDNEYNSIIYELWNRIPSLENDPNAQPIVKTKERKK